FLFCVDQSSCFTISLIFILIVHTHIFTLSLHDALPISLLQPVQFLHIYLFFFDILLLHPASIFLSVFPLLSSSVSSVSPSLFLSDRKSTRLNSSHVSISYAVFCLKK